MRLFFAHSLIVVAAWSVVIKYIFPIAWVMAYASHEPITYRVTLDLWPVVHVFIAWRLIKRPSGSLIPVAGVAAVEIIIIVTKFVLFLSAPEWTIWTTNWFINKVFILALFMGLLPWALLNWRELIGVKKSPATAT